MKGRAWTWNRRGIENIKVSEIREALEKGNNVGVVSSDTPANELAAILSKALGVVATVRQAESGAEWVLLLADSQEEDLDVLLS